MPNIKILNFKNLHTINVLSDGKVQCERERNKKTDRERESKKI